jgi:hypothetical protein
MKITIYQSKTNSDLGFSIQEDSPKDVSLWIDEYEGGDAYVTDWNYLEEFTSKEDAMKYIIDNYGQVEKKA